MFSFDRAYHRYRRLRERTQREESSGSKGVFRNVHELLLVRCFYFSRREDRNVWYEGSQLMLKGLFDRTLGFLEERQARAIFIFIDISFRELLRRRRIRLERRVEKSLSGEMESLGLLLFSYGYFQLYRLKMKRAIRGQNMEILTFSSDADVGKYLLKNESAGSGLTGPGQKIKFEEEIFRKKSSIAGRLSSENARI